MGRVKTQWHKGRDDSAVGQVPMAMYRDLPRLLFYRMYARIPSRGF